METYLLFFIAAIAAGAINSLAGGGGLITFPLLTLVVSPVTADATSALALLPAYPTAVWRTRSEVAVVPARWLWLLLIPSVLGGLVGALLPPIGTVTSRRHCGHSRWQLRSPWRSTGVPSEQASVF